MRLSPFVLSLGITLAAGGWVACDKPAADAPASDPAPTELEPAEPEGDADPREVVRTLEDDAVSGERRLEAIHQARNGRVVQAVPALRELLNTNDPAIVVAAAAALDGLEAKDAAGDIVEAASRLSRNHQYEYLRQLLFVVGDVGGPQARIYLETLAEGHQVPGIRQTAAQVLEEMRP